MNMIETNKLTKYYGKAKGIVDLDLVVKEGEIFGFIGPNGAGKSTTIRTLLGLIYKTSGSATVLGLDIEQNATEILSQVGYLPSEVFYYDRMTAIELLTYSASFYKQDCTRRIKELAEELELNLEQKIEDMSLGNKKKVGIVQGLLHSPKLIILDEPTSGLDPLMQQKFFDLIRRENERGATILFSSHILSEVQKICDRVGIIKDGTMLKVQDVHQLNEHKYKKVNLVLENPVEAFQLEGATNICINETTITFMYQGDCKKLLEALVTYTVKDVMISEPSLEDIFMHYYQ